MDVAVVGGEDNNDGESVGSSRGEVLDADAEVGVGRFEGLRDVNRPAGVVDEQ